MPSAIRVAIKLIAEEKFEEARATIKRHLEGKPYAVWEPDFKTFINSPSGRKLLQWHVLTQQQVKSDG